MSGPDQLLRTAGPTPEDRLNRSSLTRGEYFQVLLLTSHRRVATNRHVQNTKHRHRVPLAERTEGLNEASHLQLEPRRFQVRINNDARRSGVTRRGASDRPL